jgi:hypothetical protein
VKKAHALGIGLALFLTNSFSSSVGAATKAGASCTKLNQVSRSGSNILICQKLGKKKVWKVDDNLTKMCTTFNSIEAWATDTGAYIPSKVGLSGPAQPKDQAGWDQKLVFIDDLIKYSPAEYKQRATLYRTIVAARAEMLAAYNFVLVGQLPADVRSAFINKYYADQLKANEAIDFWRVTCKS